MSIRVANGATSIGYGDRIDVRGSCGRVISQGDRQTGTVTVETRNGTYSVTPYDRVFRSRLDSPHLDVSPGPRDGYELASMRSRGW